MKTRKKFTREFKISILCELENGINAAQISRENSIHEEFPIFRTL